MSNNTSTHALKRIPLIKNFFEVFTSVAGTAEAANTPSLQHKCKTKRSIFLCFMFSGTTSLLVNCNIVLLIFLQYIFPSRLEKCHELVLPLSPVLLVLLKNVADQNKHANQKDHISPRPEKTNMIQYEHHKTWLSAKSPSICQNFSSAFVGTP